MVSIGKGSQPLVRNLKRTKPSVSAIIVSNKHFAIQSKYFLPSTSGRYKVIPPGTPLRSIQSNIILQSNIVSCWRSCVSCRRTDKFFRRIDYRLESEHTTFTGCHVQRSCTFIGEDCNAGTVILFSGHLVHQCLISSTCRHAATFTAGFSQLISSSRLGDRSWFRDLKFGHNR